MDGETFPFQATPFSLNNFLVVKSGGKNIDQLAPVISPVIDISRFIWETRKYAASQTAASTTTFTAFQNGIGTYRITAHVSGYVRNGAGAGEVTWLLGPTLADGNIPLVTAYLAASEVKNFEGVSMTQEVEITDATDTLLLVLSLPGGTAGQKMSYDILIQRIR